MDHHTNSKVLNQIYIDHGYKFSNCQPLNLSTSQPELVYPYVVKRWILASIFSELRTTKYLKYENQSMFSPQTVPHIHGGYSKCV